jgi:hypothetical protein
MEFTSTNSTSGHEGCESVLNEAVRRPVTGKTRLLAGFKDAHVLMGLPHRELLPHKEQQSQTCCSAEVRVQMSCGQHSCHGLCTVAGALRTKKSATAIAHTHLGQKESSKEKGGTAEIAPKGADWALQAYRMDQEVLAAMESDQQY